MIEGPLISPQHEVEDLDDAVELCYRKGWTDGLPVVPPTEEKVRRALAVAGREPGEVLGYYAARKRIITVEKIAINAVMAGCLPEYLPVVLAIVESMLETDFNMHVANSSTGGAAIGFIVNGPIRHKLSMNYWGNVLGPGNRANSTIGRAVRLAQINVMGSVAGAGGEDELGRAILDRSIIGQPGKYAGYHIAENEEAYPSLLPLHVELGYSQESSVVTTFATYGHAQVAAHASQHNVERMVEIIAHQMVGTGHLSASGFCVVLLPPDNAEDLVRAGWTKADFRNALFERTTRTAAWAKRQGLAEDALVGTRGGPITPEDEEQTIAIAGSPEQIYVVAAGAPGGSYVHFLLPFYVNQPHSRLIRE